jgi:hypothetical protein
MGMLSIWWVNLESMDLRQVIKPVVDSKGGLLVGLYLSRTKAIAEEDSSAICGDRAYYLEVSR